MPPPIPGGVKCMGSPSKVKSKATSPESSPEGHWSKNFAALSVHRRKDWAVTVKGFNQFVWDFEGATKTGKTENAYGIFASHGSILIANSEEALKAHDVNNGWDWTKIPGATTMSLTLPQARLKKARNFSPLSSAGGVTHQGPDTLSSGVFGMDFHQPKYQFFDKSHPHKNIKLHFKKSVFLYQNVLVCLGSNIRIENGPGIKAQTTLFQDKLVRGASSFSIKVDGTRKDSSSSPFTGLKPYSPRGSKGYTSLVDTKGNSYYIPGSSASSLKVQFQNQDSETPAAEPSSGIYATAWLEHTSSDAEYEYANDEAHVVKFGMTPEHSRMITPLYGYVIFKSTSNLPSEGLIKKVNNRCRIMAEENKRLLYLSISYPDLNFPADGSKVLKTSGDVKKRELYEMESGEIQIEVTLTKHVDKILKELPKVHGSPVGYAPTVRVDSSASSPPNKGNKIVFANLKNGFSVNSRATSAEPSPEGHSSKNFAALSVHRRKDWAVTVKGFNKFVWDFEGATKTGKTENAYGIFASHGSILIANSEEALKAHDVNNGWDWTKIPGATTMSLTLQQARLKTARNFSPLSSAGGVTYQGPDTLSSGVFGMDFHQPKYQFFDKSHPHPNIKLHFKKSVFLYQNVLVCLGSNIRIENGPGIKAQTTLFQDKLVRGASTFSIKVDGTRKDSSSSPFTGLKPYSPRGSKGYTSLVDTKGNSYYIPGSSASSLKVQFQNQDSKTPAAKPSNGKYATAWLEHTSSAGKYEYAVFVKTPSYPQTADHYWNRLKNTPPAKILYRVLQQNDEAHVVKFGESPERHNVIDPLYGYVIFKSTSTLPSGGLIKEVNNQCRIMAEDNGRELYLSISYPDLNFPGSKVLKTTKDIKKRELFEMESEEIQIEVTLTGHVDTNLPESAKKVHGSPVGYAPTVRVESSASSTPNKGNKVVFANLKNGFSVEIKLTK
ncbi:hypothetical protein OS493_017606 [Desmophyllum pertusum]|uniref:Polysaccharide lyase family 8 central domain-containing protein n=1 Tax=Desmophyllum pertusum TaxID=174260 RepID=A0A9X0CYJ1_9CNID|nr:hypothetical protein OS493_017606 [Desmophyllum pertusum]